LNLGLSPEEIMDTEFSGMARQVTLEDTSILSSFSKFLQDNIIDVLEDLTPVENRRPSRSSSCPRGARSDMKLEPSQPIATRPLMDSTNVRVSAVSPVKIEKDDEWGWNDSPVAPKALPRARAGVVKKKLLVTSKDKDQNAKPAHKPVEAMHTPHQEAKRDVVRARDQDPPVKTPSSAEKGLLGAVVSGISVFGKQATDFLNTLDANFEQIFTGNEQQLATTSSSSSSSSKVISPEINNNNKPSLGPLPAAKPVAIPQSVSQEKAKQSVVLPVVKKTQALMISQATPPVPIASLPNGPTMVSATTQNESSVLEAMMESLDLNKAAALTQPSSSAAAPITAAAAAEKKKVQVKALMQEIATLRREKDQMARELAQARQSSALSEDENLALMMRQVESLMEDKARLMAENTRLANENQGLHMLLAFTTEATNAAMGTPDRWKLHNEAISLLSPSPSQSGGSGSQSTVYSYLLASAKKSPTMGSHSSYVRPQCDGAAIELVKSREEVSRSLEFDVDQLESTTREMDAVRQYYNLLFTQSDDDADEIDLIVDELVASVEERVFVGAKEEVLD
jgi:hypothetical protein